MKLYRLNIGNGVNGRHIVSYKRIDKSDLSIHQTDDLSVNGVFDFLNGFQIIIDISSPEIKKSPLLLILYTKLIELIREDNLNILI